MGIMDKLKLGKHYRMERFSMMFCSMLVGLFLVTGVCFSIYMQQQDTTLTERAVYSESFKLSRTGLSGSVEHVYTSKDKTKTFLLMKFDEPDKVSMNAKNYQMFLTAANVNQNKMELDGIPSGSIYTFGNTGYMGVYLVNKNGFSPQILDLTIRANKELSIIDESSDVDAEVEDASFAKHDQLRVYFNPGASETEPLSCLDASKAPSPLDFYNETVIVNEEASIHESLNGELAQMQVDLANIKEMEERALNAGLKLPEQPDAIRGDVILSEEAKNGKTTLVYKPKTVLPGGYDLDWQNTSVVDGFFDDLIAKTKTPNMTVDQFLAMMAAEENGDASEGQFKTDIEWEMTDGTLVSDLNTGANSTRYTELAKVSQDVENSWRSYYSHKKTYQQNSLSSLLMLELKSDGVRNNSSVNADDNVLQCY